jgi:hypothetical protein
MTIKTKHFTQPSPLLDISVEYGEYFRTPVAPDCASYPGEYTIDSTRTHMFGLIGADDARMSYYIQPRIVVGYGVHASQHNYHSILACESSIDAAVLEANIQHMLELTVQEYGGVDYNFGMYWKAVETKSGLTHYLSTEDPDIDHAAHVPELLGVDVDVILLEGYGIQIESEFIVFSTKQDVLDYMIKKYNEL